MRRSALIIVTVGIITVFVVTFILFERRSEPRRGVLGPAPHTTSQKAAKASIAHTFHPGQERLPQPPTRRLREDVTFCPILMFHYVRIDRSANDILGQNLSVAPGVFAAEMRFLRVHHFHTITVAQLADHIRYGSPLPSHPVALTFDDGYEDHYTSVLPILRRYGLRATFFIVSGFADTPRYMTWAQIRTLDRDGMEIGVHTLDHVDLTLLPRWRLWQEVHRSKAIIEQHLGHPATVFAYPSGAFNWLVRRDVRKTGYLAAVSTLPGTLHAQKSLDYLFRVRIQNTDTPQTMYGYLTTRFGDPFEPSPSFP